MFVTIYSVLADTPEWRLAHHEDGARDAQGRITPFWSGDTEDYDLEGLFRRFNRVTERDSERLDAIGYRLPSLSVGDIIQIDRGTGPSGQSMHMVLPVGFAEIDDETYAEVRFGSRRHPIGAPAPADHRPFEVAHRIARSL